MFGGNKMPKVTDEYLETKRNFILDCVAKVYEEKPLYQVTMRDVIQKTGFSQGNIYRYYDSLDEICVALVNRYTPDGVLEKVINDIFDSGASPAEKLEKSLMALGHYMKELHQAIGARMYFHLLVHASVNFKNWETLAGKLKFKLSIDWAKEKMIKYLFENLENGEFEPIIPVDSILMFINVSFDGIADDAALFGMQGDKPDLLAFDISEMFSVLTKAVIHFLKPKKL